MLFAGLALAALLAGAGMFLAPGSLATLPSAEGAALPWGWPIGPLAMRFLGAIALALGLSAGLLARRPDAPSQMAFFIALAITSSWFLIHLLANAARIDWARPLAYAWLLSLALSWVMSQLAIWSLRPRLAHTTALPPTPRAVRPIPLLIGALTLPVGALMFFAPAIGRARWPWDLGDSINVQLFGAFFLSVGMGALWAWRRPSWYGYDLIYPGAGAFSLVALIGVALHWRLFDGHPITRWVFVAVYALAALLGLGAYLRYARGAPLR